jgi:hypothetical protein
MSTIDSSAPKAVFLSYASPCFAGPTQGRQDAEPARCRAND